LLYLDQPGKSPVNNAFGLIIIGDEIILGGREDRHLTYFRQLLDHRGYRLDHCWYLPDDETVLISHLRFSMTQTAPVFVCGGIGATTDDLTRASAATATDQPLQPHPGAVALIEARFGDQAYPIRIQMAHLPRGAELIPNPYNQIPGFSIKQHYFLPGFPQMAWPMAEWIMDKYHPTTGPKLNEHSLQVLETPESALVEIMKRFNKQFPEIKLFSLPTLGEENFIELGIRGRGDIRDAFVELQAILRREQIPFR
jgi:molybdopterin-biosynthesis enzyme MoeA-like protein